MLVMHGRPSKGFARVGMAASANAGKTYRVMSEEGFFRTPRLDPVGRGIPIKIPFQTKQ